MFAVGTRHVGIYLYNLSLLSGLSPKLTMTVDFRFHQNQSRENVETKIYVRL